MGDETSEVNLMEEEVCNVNSKISVDCLKRRYPKIDVQKDIVDKMNREYCFFIRVPGTIQYEPLTAAHLSDKRYWMSNFGYDRLYAKIIEVTGNAGLGYGMGREFFLDNDMMNFLGPIISVKGVLQHMPETMEKWNHTKKGIVIENSDGHFKFAIAHHLGVIVSPFAIDYHLGIFDGVAEVCGLVGFETQLVFADKKTHYYEFEGEYDFQRLLTRALNQYIIKNLPHVKKTLEVARKKTINSREASIRERILREEKEHESRNLEKFVSKRVIEQCRSDKGPERTLEETSRSIMFTDIRDFTPLSERVDKQVIAKLLNQYFEAMNLPITGNNGWVDKYEGDAIMASFPTAYDAVSCAINMRKELERFNGVISSSEDYRKNRIPSLRTGIGIATGNVLLGNMGSEERMNETAIGDIVNTASRLEGLTKEYHVPVIIDEFTYKGIEGKVLTREIDVVKPRGKNNEIRIYEVLVPQDLH